MGELRRRRDVADMLNQRAHKMQRAERGEQEQLWLPDREQLRSPEQLQGWQQQRLPAHGVAEERALREQQQWPADPEHDQGRHWHGRSLLPPPPPPPPPPLPHDLFDGRRVHAYPRPPPIDPGPWRPGMSPDYAQYAGHTPPGDFHYDRTPPGRFHDGSLMPPGDPWSLGSR